MKLRNKMTGEIYEPTSPIEFTYEDESDCWTPQYSSLAELNEVWEDAPDEPLIKNEKARKAVRAWAEALDLRWFRRCGSVNAHTSRLYGQDANGTGYTIELATNDLYGNSISKKGYTIAELCGEEEE